MYTLAADVISEVNAVPSTVLSVRVPEALKEQLDYLSRATKRSRAYLAAEALDDYVKRNAWRAKELHDALEEAGRGAFISHEAMLAWADSLGSQNELPPPEPDIFSAK
jgi:RHH-type transcriptional regulator, rel operon repressor / antitoxin RelB